MRLIWIALLVLVAGCKQQGVIHLEGDWYFKKGFQRDWLTLTSFKGWHKIAHLKDIDQLIKVDGFKGWVTLRRQLPPDTDHAVARDAIAVSTGDLADVSVLYLNETIVSQRGNVVPYVSGYRKHILAQLPSDGARRGGPNILTLALFGGGEFPTRYYGPRFVMGEVEKIYRAYHHHDLVQLTLLMIYFLVGLYHIMLGIKRPQDLYNLYMGLFSFFIAGFTFFKTNFREEIFADVLTRSRFENITAYWSVPMFMLFLSQYFDRRHSFFGLAWVALTAVLSIVILFSPFPVLRMALLVFEIAALATMVYAVVFIIMRAFGGERDALYMIAGVAMILVGGVNDILEDRLIIQTVPIFQYSILLFVIGVTILLASRFMRAMSDVEDLNVSLEKKVEERTQELKSKDDLMQVELDFAADIQRGIIPNETLQSHGLTIASYFQAMEKVSGDYFDVFTLKDGKLGVLMADVSGHGVPAALITTMAKVAFTSSGHETTSPADTFRSVNDQLTGMIHTQEYLTAFYAVFDADKSFQFANAAHPRPLLHRAADDSIEWLDTAGMLIGALEEASKSYSEKSAQLKTGDRLILYTDGIFEGRNSAREEYGHDRLLAVVKETAKSSPDETISAMVADFENFRGGAARNDDCTILVIGG